jgi:flavorubredoxin
MDNPRMFEPFEAAPDAFVLPAYFPIPGLGMVPVNAFLLKAAEPVLVDTGLVPLGDEFVNRLASLIDLRDLKWLWLTHTDQDHIGSLQPLLEKSPKLRVITTYLGVGRMSLFRPLPMDRVYLLNPGQTMSVGDRRLRAVKPPSYDAAETTGFYDERGGVFFSSDCFGALMSEPARIAADIGSDRLREGLVKWATVDAPWLHNVKESSFAKALDGIRDLAPEFILSSHLPPAHDMAEELLQYLALAPSAEPFVGPDQQALEAMLRGPGARELPRSHACSLRISLSSTVKVTSKRWRHG